MHVAMFPWVAMGHITPFIHVANELANRGHLVTLLIPEKPANQLRHLILYPNLVSVHVIAVPSALGLPTGTQTTADIHISNVSVLAGVFDQTRPAIRNYLHSARPDVVFYDFAHWLPSLIAEVASSIVAVNFSTVSAASIAYALVPARSAEALSEADLRIPPIGYPSSTAVFSGSEVRSLVFLSFPFGPDGVTFFKRVTSAMALADVICIRTCRELESELCDYVAEQYKKPLLLTGPILPTQRTGSLESRWEDWLGSFGDSSVVYCAFGSQIVLDRSQFQELLLGLELTGYNFLAAMKPPKGCETVEEAFPKGFEERVKGRGIVFGGWVQQTLLLDHPSIGCFVSHCGFSSMWESLTSDVQIVLVPYLGDQILNTKLLAGDLGVAVDVERDHKGDFRKEGLCEAIRSVMEKNSEIGNTIKRNHDKWRRDFTKPDFMSSYVDDFVEKLQHLVDHKQKHNSTH